MTAEFEVFELASVGVQVLDCEHKTPLPVDEGFPYVAIPDIQDGRVRWETTRQISEDDLEEWTRRSTPQEGDILVTRRGRVGDTAPIPTGVRCAIGQNLVLLRATAELLDPNYLRWAVRGPQWWSEVDRLMNVGAIFSSLNVRDIGKIRIPIPPLPDQQAIAEVLGALDDKIAANTKVAATADKLATAVLMDGSDRNTKVVLSTIAELTMGSSPSGDTLNDLGQGTVFYQGVRDFGVRFPSNRIWTTAPARMATKGDTLISVRAPVGRVNLADENLCIGRGLASARSTDDRPATLFHLLKLSTEVWEPFEAEGTVFGSINKKQLAEIELPRIRPELVAKTEANLQSLEARISVALQENQTLAATRDALLPQLMSGKLRVKDTESIISAAV